MRERATVRNGYHEQRTCWSLCAFKYLAFALALSFFAVPGLGVTATPHNTEAAATYAFAFQNADISAVAEEILGQAIGVPYSIDPSVNAKLTFRIERRLTKEQLLKAFEATLATQDIVLVRQGDNLLITSRAKANGSSGFASSAEGLHRAGYQTLAVPLSYATPSEVAKALEAISPNSHVVVYLDDKTGLLVLGGTGDEIDAVLQTIRVFDRSGLEGGKIRWFELSQVSASTVANDLDRIFQAAGASNITVIPLARLNGIFVVARTPTVLDQVANWVGQLDVPSKDVAPSLWVYKPRNLAADSLAVTLGSVLPNASVSSSGSSQPSLRNDASQLSSHGDASQGAPRADAMQAPAAPQATASSSGPSSADPDAVRLGVDTDANTLVVSAPLYRWLQIQKILDQIDKTPGQVLIEASILEVNLSNEFRLGVDWSVLANSGRLTVESIPTGATAAPTLPGFAVTFLDNNIAAAVSALRSRTDVEILSAPKIVALDNHVAKLQVGDQVPIVTQSAQTTTAAGAPVIDSVTYQSTGIILNVIPRITGDDRVMLDVDQEVSSVAQTTTSSINSPTIQQRQFQSSVIVSNGATIALGGLISSNKTYSDGGIPYLKDAPVVGALFRSTDNNLRRTELIVLITASIIKDQSDADRLLGRLLADMKDVDIRDLVPQ